MFGTIRRHQKWLWLAIIIPTIITFVWYFGPTSKLDNGRRGSVDYGSINGQRVSQAQFAKAHSEVKLQYFFMTGRFPEEDRNSRFDPIGETYRWLLLLQKQDELGIRVGEDTVEETARALLRPFERSGMSAPAEFAKRVLQPQGLDPDDFERYVRHYAGLQELISTVALGGKLVTPEEARQLYTREHQELATEAVFFSASNYLAGVSVPAEALTQFYSNNLAAYIIPERVQVKYVRFSVSNYMAQAETDLKTNLNELVETNYQHLGTNLAVLFPDAKTPEAAKAKIRERLIQHKAIDPYAKSNAFLFASKLLDMNPVRPSNFDDLARTNGLSVGVSAPFSRSEGPEDLNVGADFVKAAFGLTPEEPFAGPILGQDGAYEIAINKTLPRETPSLDQVKAKVTGDYKRQQAMTMAFQASQAFYPALTNGLAQGKSFSAICTESQLKPVPLPAFSISTRELPEVEEHLSVDQFKTAAFGTPSGKATSPMMTSDGGMILFVKAKLPVDEAKMRADLPNFTQMVRRRRQDDAFNLWFGREIERGLRNIPLLAKPQQAPPTMSPGAKAKS
ncbi:MAG TPA: SurA N-terminal domain-containing protein [Candidatus Binatia bacterium]|jgi:hypothetical protein|nr:SurA N-terminal domain-containing protein [Candidatus Binatia bacterium]